MVQSMDRLLVSEHLQICKQVFSTGTEFSCCGCCKGSELVIDLPALGFLTEQPAKVLAKDKIKENITGEDKYDDDGKTLTGSEDSMDEDGDSLLGSENSSITTLTLLMNEFIKMQRKYNKAAQPRKN